jgi:hypothetical protein
VTGVIPFKDNVFFSDFSPAKVLQEGLRCLGSFHFVDARYVSQNAAELLGAIVLS